MTNEKEAVSIFDPSVYPVEAVLGAAYKYIDRLYCHLSFTNDGSAKNISAQLKPKTKMAKKEWDALLADFHDETTSQALRVKILEATRETRDQVMSLALYCVSADGTTPQIEPPADCQADAAGAKREEELDRILEKIKQKMGDAGEYEEDPMDIMTPWEDKYGDRDQEPPESECNENDTVRQTNL